MCPPLFFFSIGHGQLIELHTKAVLLPLKLKGSLKGKACSASCIALSLSLSLYVETSLAIHIWCIYSQTTYTINGPPVEGLIRGRLFADKVTYIDSGICTTKRACDDGYTVKVNRILSDNKKEIQMTSSVTYDDTSKPTVECRQRFQRTE